MKKNLLIIGASGHGKVVADIALKMKKWSKIGFLDDNQNIKSSMGLEVIGKTSEASKYFLDYDIFVGIGKNATREKIQQRLEKEGATIPILLHPSAVIGEKVEVEQGTVVMAGVVINCCTSIGKGCIINTSSSIDHDNLIEDYVHISPGAHLAGTVKVGKGSWLGIGSLVSNNISIERGCIVGAGSVVIKNLPANCTAVGTPAKPIKFEKIR